MRKILLALMFFAFLTGVSAQSLQNFEYSPGEDDYPIDLTGGESFTQSIEFTNEANQDLPFGVRVVVESNNTDFESGDYTGAEFDVKGTLATDGSEDSLDIDFSKMRLTNEKLIYVGTLPEAQSLSQSFNENNLELQVETDQAIRPDNFNFNFDVRAAPGFASESNNTEFENEIAQATVDESSVSVNSDNGQNLAVESYEETTVSAPEDTEFVGGLGVEVTDSRGDKADAEGTISIAYDQDVVNDDDLDEDSMQIYYYNESSMSWTTEGVEIVDRDTDENLIEAEVTHFSTYAAFAEEEQDSSSGGSGGDFDPSDFIDDADEPEEDVDVDQNADDQESDESSEDDVQEQPEEEQQQEENAGQEDQIESEETTQQPNSNNPSESQGITGLFTASESGGLAAAVLGVVLAVFYLQRKDKIELRNGVESLVAKLSR